MELNVINSLLSDLKRHIQDGTLNEFTVTDDLTSIMQEVLRYDCDDNLRPTEILNVLYNEFKDIYPYSGKVYHGFLSMLTLDNILDKYEGLVSCSSSIDIAYMFGKYIDTSMRTQTLSISETKEGFALYKLLDDIYNTFPNEFEFVEEFIKEYEILTPMNIKQSKLISVIGKSLDEIKEEIK